MSKKTLFISICCLVFFFGKKTILAQQNSLQKHQQILIQPDYLKAGDTVAIVAPSGILKNRFEAIEKAKLLLKSWNLNVVVGENVFNQNGHFSGTDNERASDFQKALDNPNYKAIWCARGGYGSVRILDKLDYSKFKTNPKWLIGFSDITSLHNQFHIEGYQSIHAILCTSLESDAIKIKESIATLKKALFGNDLGYTIKSSKYNKLGTAKGQLIGGNLTVLHTMLGSKTSLNTENKILFIEEIGEYAYHIDRMLQSLKRAGYFEKCNGLIIGDISRVRKNTTKFGRTIEQIFLDVVSEYDFPVLFNFPAGHKTDNRAMIFGNVITLSVEKTKGTLIFKK